MRKFKHILLFSILQYNAFGQQNKIDSLFTLIKTDKTDTSKLVHLNLLSREFYKLSLYDSAEYFSNSIIELSTSIYPQSKDSAVKYSVQKNKAQAFIVLGMVENAKNNYQLSIQNYSEGLKLYTLIGNLKGEGSAYNNIGNSFISIGNYPEALKNFFSCLKIFEKLDNKMALATTSNGIGSVYRLQNNDVESLKYSLLALKYFKEVNDIKGMAGAYGNIGVSNSTLGNYQEAIKNLLLCLKLYTEVDNQKGIANSHIWLGQCYFSHQNYDEALKHFNLALNITITLQDKSLISSTNGSIGQVLMTKKKFSEARIYFNEALKASQEIGVKIYLKETYKNLAKLDSAIGNYKGAYENNKMYILYRDSIDNEETRKKTIQSQMTYDFEKKEAVADAEHKKELENQQELAEEKSRKQRTIILFVACGLLLVVVFAGFIFRSLRITRSQKNIIVEQKRVVELQKQEVETQKHIVEEHQKEIIDSITYARRIQRSLLPTDKYIEKTLNRLIKK